jgi:hypothetical protein
MSKISLSGPATGTATFTITTPAGTSTDRTVTLPDAAGTIQVSGNPISGTTGTFTGLVDISAAGAGQIQFPATQNASSNANTLDDYEEGTWTPTVSSGTFSTTSSGRYTKIGRQVTVIIDGSLGGTRGSESFVIGGLPFVNSSGGWSAAPMYTQFPISTYQQVMATVRSGAAEVEFNAMGTNALGNQFTNGYINFCATYFI